MNPAIARFCRDWRTEPSESETALPCPADIRFEQQLPRPSGGEEKIRKNAKQTEDFAV